MEGVKVKGRNVTNLRYANDTVLIANSQENLQAILSVVTYESESMGLQLYTRKTECMKRLNRMWVDGQGDIPVVLRPGFQSRKKMFTVFFSYSGPLVVDILPQDTATTASYYVQNVLSQVKSAINEQRPKVSTSRTLLLRENAGPHKARATTQSLRELGIQVLAHTAYSPDLAPCDFWLFPILKDRLAGRKFDRIQDLAKAVNSELRTIPEEDYQRKFRKWQIRLKRCIESRGEYFKGM
ncbi:transposase [Elysia marginata]|uniref:Transposase n=1 Tax=Elysia marginata TaxID=1093978 RepID=A0AAV4EQC5_9GAST|nr:transposase [Elysia marginata]